MNGKKVVSACYPTINKIVTDLGYVLVDMEYKKTAHGMVLELFIDNEKGITLDDCEKVSKAVDAPLDEINPTGDESYSLNVSSLGLDKPIATEYHFRKYLGKQVVVKFYSPFLNSKQLQVILLDFDNSSVTVSYDNETYQIEKSKIAQIVPYVEI